MSRTKGAFVHGDYIRCSLADAGTALYDMVTHMDVAVRMGFEDGIRKVAKDGSKVARDEGTYENRRPKYRKSLGYRTSGKEFFFQAQLYAKGHEYSLTHLLEKSHSLWQAPEKKTREFPHWKPAKDWIQENIASYILNSIKF